MQTMLIIITIISIISAASLSWVLYQMIQPGQLLEGWQNILAKVYGINPFLEMFLGGCYKCFAHFISIITFIPYLIIQNHIEWLGWWNIAVYIGYISVSIVISMIINKLLNDSDIEDRLYELENRVNQCLP